MSLRTDYFDGLTGLQTKMSDAFDAGAAYITTNMALLSTGLISNAAQGKTTFTVNVPGTGPLNPVYLRGNNGNNLLLKAFIAGLKNGLAAQDIFEYECTPGLNIASSSVTSVDFNFTFQST